MGRDKALLPFRGRVLCAIVADSIKAAAGNSTLVGDPALYADLGFPAIPDLYPGEGPLGGILTALAATQSDWNLITACDLPGLEGSFLRRLFEAAERAGADALLPFYRGGRPQPLCGIYHRRCQSALDAVFRTGVRKVATALESIRVEAFAVEEVAHFQNVNTPEDWAGYAAV